MLVSFVCVAFFFELAFPFFADSLFGMSPESLVVEEKSISIFVETSRARIVHTATARIERAAWLKSVTSLPGHAWDLSRRGWGAGPREPTVAIRRP